MNVSVANLGWLLLGLGLILYGILLLAGTALPPELTAIWAIVTGLLILVAAAR